MTRDELRTWLAPLPEEAILALTLYGEARGEPIEGIIAVGCVIRNRVLDAKRRWGNDYRSVCLQKAQFSCFAPVGGAANHQAVIDAATILLTHHKAPPLLEQCAWVVAGVARGAVIDTVHAANHYHSVSVKVRPKWAQAYAPVKQISGHVFYKL
jgi:spore germination cell wall hydrolase CwlJ-like protein